MNAQEIMVRAAKTWLQTFTGAIAAGGIGEATDVAVLKIGVIKAAALATFSALASVANNLGLNYVARPGVDAPDDAAGGPVE